jgi:hypothetical protein
MDNVTIQGGWGTQPIQQPTIELVTLEQFIEKHLAGLHKGSHTPVARNLRNHPTPRHRHR